MPAPSLLDKERTIAGPGYDRWMVPPAALAVHLSIGQAYGFSVFNPPLARLIGVSRPAPGDWALSSIGWIFSVAIVMLGLSAALFGKWVERAGPRKTMVVAALCFSSGFLIAAVGVRLHALPVIILGYGVVGGIGLGLGYISPVSTLIRWFPDRPGLATGMAIMGFGGGALIGAPLSTNLMRHYATATSTGVAETFLTLGALYLVFMLLGATIVRVPPAGWRPRGYTLAAAPRRLVTSSQVLADQAVRTPQFWLLWGVLFLNVTAGIGVLGQASLMIRETFPLRFPDVAAAPAVAAGAAFTAILSLFNIAGRFFFSALSDWIGRQPVYCVYFLLGALLYALLPSLGRSGNVLLFTLCCGVIFSMYGGGFSTIPAYLRDLFGPLQVGAIHGRLLTAWSAAGIAGPSLVNYIREYQIGRGVARAESYAITMYLMSGLLLCGLLCNLLVRAVAERHSVALEDGHAGAQAAG